MDSGENLIHKSFISIRSERRKHYLVAWLRVAGTRRRIDAIVYRYDDVSGELLDWVWMNRKWPNAVCRAMNYSWKPKFSQRGVRNRVPELRNDRIDNVTKNQRGEVVQSFMANAMLAGAS